MGRTIGFCAGVLALLYVFESVAWAQPLTGEPASPRAAPPAKARKHRHRPRPPSQPWRKRGHAKRAAAAPGNDGADRAWHFLLGAERLTSVLHFDLDSSAPGAGSVSATEISFLGGGSASGGNPFALPRVAFDGMYGSFTFGGSVVYMTSSNNLGDGSMLLLSPRLGALWPRSGVVRMWLRGGLSVASARSDVVGTTFEGERLLLGEVTLNYLDLTLEPLLALMPTERVGITLGPSLDFALSGSATAEYNELTGMSPVELDGVHASSYGVTAGLVVIF